MAAADTYEAVQYTGSVPFAARCTLAPPDNRKINPELMESGVFTRLEKGVVFMSAISKHQIPRKPPRIPKIQERVEITMSDGAVLKGHVFIEATMRIQDLLNDAPRFFPLMDDNAEVHLISKAAIARVRPYDG